MRARTTTTTAAGIALVLALSGCSGVEAAESPASELSAYPPAAASTPTASDSCAVPGLCGGDWRDSQSAEPTEAAETSSEETSTGPETDAHAAESVDLVCGSVDRNVDFTVHTVRLAADGSADFKNLWAAKVQCDNGFASLPVDEAVAVTTPLQRAVVEAARRAEYEGEDDEVLYSVYQFCGSNDPDDPYLTMEDYSESQVLELRALMTLCPKHPQAAKWKAGIAATGKAQEAQKNGARVYDGTYKIPSEMQRGTFVVKDVENCYWETRDSNGNILDNNFVLAAPRVVATVTGRAVVFTSEGCGEWNRQ